MSSTRDLPQDQAYAQPVAVAYTDTETRLAFLRKVYALFGCTMAVWAGTTWLVMSNESLLTSMFNLLSGGFLVIILLMGAMFMMLRMTANRFPLNLVGLGIFGIFEGFMTAPLVFSAMLQSATEAERMEMATTGVLDPNSIMSGAGIVGQAFVLTAALFSGLTIYAMTTKRDFTWMGGALYMVFFALIGFAILAMFGIGESIVSGWGFAAAFVVLMGAFVLYDTQKIMKTYPENMAAAGAAMLFLDFVIMFKYMLMLLMRRN